MSARLLSGVSLVLLAGVLAQPASAVRARIGVSGGITVYPDLGACGSLTFDRPVTAVGALSSAGVVTGPGTATAPVHGALPVTIVEGRTWYGCLPDAYAGGTTGYATYTLAATSVDGDFVESLHCTIHPGGMSCT